MSRNHNDHQNDEYRANAAECERIARYTRNESERRTWLEMADSWLRLIRPAPSGPADRFDPDERHALGALRARPGR
jgi:hypothetical protein